MKWLTLVLDKIKDHAFYSITVVAKDIQQNKLKDSRKFEYKQGVSIDDLAPGYVSFNSKKEGGMWKLYISKPNKNIDGSMPLDDLLRYNIYYSLAPFNSVKNQQVLGNLDSSLLVFNMPGNLVPKRYYTAISSADKNGNEFKEISSQKIIIK